MFHFYRVNLEQIKQAHLNSPANESTWDIFFTTNSCIYIYSSMTILLIPVAFATFFLLYYVCIRASINLHDKMFSKVVHGFILFFNVNPSGRILNRFSKDMTVVDEILPAALRDTLLVSIKKLVT